MKKNIAIVITRLDLGGAQKVALYLAEHLDRKRFNVHFIAGKGGYLDAELGTRSSEGGVKSAIQNAKFKIQNLNLWPELIHPIHPLADIIALFKLAAYFSENKIEIVHTHSSKAGILGRLAARMAGVPVVIHTVHGFPFHKFQNPIPHGFYWLIEKLFAAITTRFIAVGRDVKEYGLKKGIGREEQYVIIRPGIDLKQFGIRDSKSGTKRRIFLQKFGLDPSKFTVGMIGNCKKQKNPMAFAEIARLVIRKKPDAQFIFAGDGPYKMDAEDFLKARKIDDRVKFTGWVDAPEIFMKSIDLFLLTSLWEGMPCTLAQAAAAKKAIIASDIEGNREFMQALGSAKYLYNPKKPAEAAAKILELAGNMKAYKARPEKLLGEFDQKLMLKQHEKLYNAR